MKKSLLILLFLSLFSGISKAQWVKSGPYTTAVLGLLVKDNSVFVSTYYRSDIIYMSDKDGEGWLKRDSGIAFGNWIVKGDQIFGAGTSCIYSSVDNGASWQPISGSPGNVHSFALSGDTIWAGINASYESILLYYSADNGVSWVLTGSPISHGVASIDELLANGSTLFAGTGSGCFTSSDKGQHWKIWNASSGNSGVECLAKVDSNTIIAGCRWGLCYTIDNGVNWSVDTSSSSVLEFHDFAQSGNKVFAATEYGVFISTDKGITWTQNNVGLPADKSVLHIVISDTIAYIGTRGDGLYKSSINQISWKSANKGIDALLNVTAIALRDSLVYAGTKDIGMYISTDYGNTWKDYNNGFGSYGSVTDLILDGAKIFASSNLHGLSVDSAGTGWRHLPLYTPVSLFKKFGDYFFANSGNYGLFRYEKNSWISPVDTAYLNVNAMVTDGEIIYAATNSGIYSSNDFGETWKNIAGITNWVNVLLCKGSILIAGQNFKGISVSTDKGNTWKQCNAGIPDPQSINYNSFTVIEDNIYLAADNKIFVSTNNGNSWIPVFTNFPPDIYINSIEANSNTLFAATSNETWQCKNCNATIGINEQSGISSVAQVDVFPNPTVGYFNIVANDQVIKQITVYNSTGVCLFQKDFNKQLLSTYDFMLDMKPGLYFIRISTDKGEIVKKVEVLH